MKLSKHLILGSTALCYVLTQGINAAAQDMLSEQDFDLIERQFIGAYADCWSVESPENYAFYYKKYINALQAMEDATKDMSQEKRDEFFESFPQLLSCPPKMITHANGAQSFLGEMADVLFGGDTANEPTQDGQNELSRSSSGVRLSGYGRFGMAYGDGTSDGSTATDRLRVNFMVGAHNIKPAQAGYGVVIVPGQEAFAGRTDDGIDGMGFSAIITSKSDSLYKNGVYTFSAEYMEADGNSDSQIANGTESVGIVYHDRAPSGSTGLNIGPRGLDVSTNSITSRLRLQFDMSTETDGGVAFGARFRQRVAVGPGIRLTDTEHTANVTTPSFNDISSDSLQRIDENFYYLNGITTLSFEPNGNKQGGIGIYITPRIEVGYRDASLNSRQTNICGLCSASDQNFTINIEDDDNGFYYDASLNADIGYNITDTVKVGISGNIGWRSKTARIVNPETGDDLFIRNNPTHLETDSEYRQSLTAWFSADF